ncbi:aminoacyl-tRNA hydrolase [Enterobacteriaceae endosymbiont of Donacia bicoloricornis]|uniref:aminoacyl-tRNA hydrolase n=1 Tax=Enterobacteriaceae endosymbiont of Donacia bicoloricornis TaxID=2675772 RepID=UPI0014491EB5|nr:aminoacyl-tRNA hydrolase [Enterobacteriaceae endosymbiont of Donacia bicoloricornis]QJC37634.1 aminoacyl-tRNA hydrolase [Enterobacteriaceae endosymbiont of Donacia bicoloricornis]
MNNIKMIVGLGNNLNSKFIKTRHNIGSNYIINLSNKFNVKFKKIKKINENIGYLNILNKKIILLIPNSFMNNSGKSIFIVSNFYKILLKNILVVHDELDYLPGIIKFKYGGGSGGHNGINSIIKIFNDKLFYRLRIGIGHPGNKNQVNNFVLNSPTLTEQVNINFTIKNSIKALLIFIKTNNYNKAINYLHSKITG